MKILFKVIVLLVVFYIPLVLCSLAKSILTNKVGMNNMIPLQNLLFLELFNLEKYVALYFMNSTYARILEIKLKAKN
ncbi:hypothetical protein C2G38_2065324 [Gigaspora rosea]|uniref:Uncharacterized protein n=1 Tax=Gigaspora rosea TaxID=44941 RepID=A0A397VWA6_9GLOM|nr:hypothetical protein C2G38_2065324 [Gigaspora rosea]